LVTNRHYFAWLAGDEARELGACARDGGVDRLELGGAGAWTIMLVADDAGAPLEALTACEVLPLHLVLTYS
jgi:hypothetical protein